MAKKPQENISRLHKNLSENWEGFNVPLEQFKEDMQNEENLKKLHTNLSNKWDGFTVEYDQFKTDMGFGGSPVGKSEEVLEEDSETVSQPSLESGQGIEPTGISDVQGGEIVEEQQSTYLVDGEEISKVELRDKLFDRDFVSSIQSGATNLSITNDDELQSLAQRQINSGSELGDKFDYLQAGALQVASGIAGFQNFIANVAEEITGLPLTKTPTAAMSKVSSEELSKKIEESLEKTRQYEEGFIGSIANGNYSDAANIGFNSLFQSAPITAAAALTGGGGVVGSSAVLSSILVPSEYAAENISEDDAISQLSNAEKLTRATLYGAAEGLGEAVTGGIASKNFKLVKDGIKHFVGKAAKQGGEGAAKEVAKDMSKKTATDMLKSFGVDIASEGGSEALTSVAQNLTDDVMGVKDLTLNDYLSDATEAAALGGFMGGVLGGGGLISNSTVKALSKPETFKSVENGIDKKLEDGEITEDQAAQLKNNLATQTQIPAEVEGEQRVKAVAAQERLNGALEAQEQASEEFKQLYEPEIQEAKKELSNIAKSVADKKQQPVKEESGFKLTEEEIQQAEEADIDFDTESQLIDELEDEQIDRVYEEEERKAQELKEESGEFASKMQYIHENLGRIRPQDFDEYGDPNIRKDMKGFNIKHASKNAQPLDVKLQEMSEMFGQEITEQDVVDYIMDRDANPSKYRQSKRKKLNDAAKIPTGAQEAVEIYRNLKNNKESIDAVNKLRGTVLTDAQADIIIKNLKQRDERREQTQQNAGRDIQPADEATTEVEQEKQVEDAVQQIQGETTEGVLRDKRMEETREEESEATQEETVEQPNKKMRGFAEKAKTKFADLREKIKNNPENFYTPQKWSSMKERLSEMTDEEIIESMDEVGLNNISDGDNNNAVLAAIETINRRLSEDKPIDDIVERFAKEGTRMGQLIAQFATLNSSTPFGIMSTINKIAEKKGKILSTKQKKKIQDLAGKMLKSVNKLDQHIKEKGGLATEKDIKELEKLKRQAELDTRAFYKDVAPFTPMTWGEMLEMTLQGNLLTPRSQITNIAANAAQQMVLTPVTVIGDLADLVASLFTKKRVSSFDPRKYAYAWWGRWNYLKDAFNSIAKGDSSYAKGEVKRSFRPMTAAIQSISDTKLGDILGIEQGLIPKSISKKQQERLLEAKKLADKGNIEEAESIRQEVIDSAKISLNDRLKKVYEATLGTPAEIMFRLLSLGDKPFYGGEVYKERYVTGRRRGLRGDELRRFVLMPDAKTMEEINEESKEVVFMEDGTLSTTAEKITSSLRRAARTVPYVGDALSFLFRTAVPYVKTPSNIISQTIDFVIPAVPISKAIYHYRKGNQKQANKNVGIASVGIMMGMAAEVLIANGLISSAIDWSDEDDKNIKLKVTNPNGVNITGLDRYMKGEDPSYKAGDTVIDISKLGIVGAIMLIRANKKRTEIREQRNKAVNLRDQKSDVDKIVDAFYLGTIPEVLKFSFEQSFLAGTSSLLEMLKGGEYETRRWVSQTANAAGAIVAPNTLSAINRATETYLYDTRSEDIEGAIQANITNRLGFALPSKYNDFPIRVDMWGDPIRRTPVGKNAYAHQFLDITKSKQVPNDPLSLEIYELYKLTQNPKVVPNMPQRNYYDDGNKYEIPKTKEGNKIYNDFAAKVQKLKREYAQKEFKKSSYKKASIEKRVEKMGDALGKYQNSYKYKKYKKELIEKLKNLKE